MLAVTREMKKWKRTTETTVLGSGFRPMETTLPLGDYTSASIGVHAVFHLTSSREGRSAEVLCRLSSP